MIGNWTDEVPADLSNLEFRSTVKEKQKGQVTRLMTNHVTFHYP